MFAAASELVFEWFRLQLIDWAMRFFRATFSFLSHQLSLMSRGRRFSCHLKLSYVGAWVWEDPSLGGGTECGFSG